MSKPFSFGAPSATPSTSAPASGGLFGSAGTSTPSFFGNASSTPASGAGAAQPNSGGLFGNQSSTAQTTPLFGAKPTNTTTTAAPSFFGASSNTGGGLFGSAGQASQATTTTTTGGGMFGSAAATPPATSSAAPAPLFGNAPATTSSSAGGLFAGTTGATLGATTPSKPMFPMPSTTPAGPPPNEAAKPSFFGATQQTSGASQAPILSFGAPKTTAAPATSSAPGSTLFGATSQPSATGNSLFGAAPTNAGAAPSGGLFGSKPTSTASPAPSGGLFGNKPASTDSPAPSGGLFGSKPATTESPAPSGGLFGNKLSTPSSQPVNNTQSSSAAPTSSLFGNAAASKPATTSGITTTAPATTSTTTTTSLFGAAPGTAAPSGGSLFGTAASKPATAPTLASSGTSAPATTATSGTSAAPSGILGGAAKPANPIDASKAAGSTVGQPASAGLSTSTMGPTSSLPRLKNKTMDEIMTRWATDLNKYQKEFKDQASKVAAWDRLLVENGEKIQKLYLETFEAERASNEIERQLQSVESQQDELASWLDRYEQEVNDMFSRQVGKEEQLAGPDQERERTYKLAERLTDRIDEMGKDLGKMIKEINDISGTISKGSKPDDPLAQIVRVLNGHLSQLQWIDANASALQSKIAAAQKSGAHAGGNGGGDGDATESFYRSYMGRH